MYRYEVEQKVEVNEPKSVRISLRISRVDAKEPVGTLGYYVGHLASEVNAPNWFEKHILGMTITSKFKDSLDNLLEQAEKQIMNDKESDKLRTEYNKIIIDLHKGDKSYDIRI